MMLIVPHQVLEICNKPIHTFYISKKKQAAVVYSAIFWVDSRLNVNICKLAEEVIHIFGTKHAIHLCSSIS